MPRRSNAPFGTQPGTEADEQRIALSLWLTAILVEYGDELPGAYITPGTETSAPPLAEAPRNDEIVVLRERLATSEKVSGRQMKNSKSYSGDEHATTRAPSSGRCGTCKWQHFQDGIPHASYGAG